MKRWGVVGSMAVVVAANVYVLIGVAMDRAGGVVQKIELTERELPIWGTSEDNTGIAVRLWHGRIPRADRTFDRAKLTELGFDCSTPPADPSAEWRYRKAAWRRAFVVMEYRGSADAVEPIAVRGWRRLTPGGTSPRCEASTRIRTGT